MKEIRKTSQFKKDYKRFKNDKEFVETLMGIVKLLAEGTPDVLHWTDSLPKTRSGKIMRRILRKIAAGDTSNLGDTSTLADPGVVDKLLEEKQAIAMPS